MSRSLRELYPNTPEAVASVMVSGVALDSRRVAAGDLFVAFPGEQGDGRDYIAAAVDAGAAAIMLEPGRTEIKTAVPLVEVPNLRECVGDIAARFYRQPSQQLHLIGVTGTNGKTTCSQLLAQLLSELEGSCGVVGTLGYGLYGEATAEASHTTPDAVTLQRLLAGWRDRGVRHAVMEVSSHGIQQGRINGTTIDVALLTNLSRDHLDYHGDMASYANVKAQLFRHSGLSAAVLNLDDALGQRLMNELSDLARVVSYSVENPDAEVHTRDVSFLESGIRATLVVGGRHYPLFVPLLGAFNLSNVLGVVGTLHAMGAPVEQWLERLSALRPVSGRMQRIAHRSPLTVVVDYAHTPDALEATLTALREHCRGELWCLFGCGGDRDQGKRPQMAEVAERLADRVVITSDNPRREDPQQIIADVVAGLKSDAQIEPDRQAAIEWVINQAGDDDLVLIAGKGHETYQEVDGQRTPFDDRQQALASLERRAQR